VAWLRLLVAVRRGPQDQSRIVQRFAPLPNRDRVARGQSREEDRRLPQKDFGESVGRRKRSTASELIKKPRRIFEGISSSAPASLDSPRASC
jgi:hypothetical protein